MKKTTKDKWVNFKSKLHKNLCFNKEEVGEIDTQIVVKEQKKNSIKTGEYLHRKCTAL